MTKPYLDESETELKYSSDRLRNGTCITPEDLHNTNDCISINSYENDLSSLLVNKHANTVPFTDIDHSYNIEHTMEGSGGRIPNSDEHKEKEASDTSEVQKTKVNNQVPPVSTPLPKIKAKRRHTKGMRNEEPEKPEPRENPKCLHKGQKQGWHILYFLLLLLPALTPCIQAKTPDHRKCDLNFNCELRNEEILLKCHYSMLCNGTKKWTGGVDGLLIFKGGVKETQSGKIFEYVDSNAGDWFGLAIKNWTKADVFAQYTCWMTFDKSYLDLFEQPIIDKTNGDDPLTCNVELDMVILHITVLHITKNPSFTFFTEKENFTQNLKVSKRSENKEPWFITDIYAQIKRENNVNKTFNLVYEGNKTVRLIEEFVQCNASEGTLSDLKDKSSTVVVAVAVVSSVCVGVIALVVLFGCYKKKISEFCSRHGKGRRNTAADNSDPSNACVLKRLFLKK